MVQSRLHIFLGKIKQEFVRRKNNQKTNRFFIKNHSRIYKPMHTQYVPECCHISHSVTIFRGARIDCYPNGNHPTPEIYIGEETFIGYSFTLLCAEKITIGKNCLFASQVFISDENHGTMVNNVPYIQQPLNTKPVEIGNNVWLGEKVIILPGVHIGDNVVIGAGSVVTHNIPKNCMAVGNPARVIKTWNEERKAWEKPNSQK